MVSSLFAATFLAASWLTLPALAATCNPNGFNVNPKTQSVQEFKRGQRLHADLGQSGVNKSASQIAAAVADGVQFNWTQIPTPPAVTVTTPVSLVNANTATPNFLTPNVTASTTLTFRLTTSCARRLQQYRHRHGHRAQYQPPADGLRLGDAATGVSG